MNNKKNPVVGIVSFTDPRKTSLAEERENYIRKNHKKLIDFLEKQGFIVVDPLKNILKKSKVIAGINETPAVELCAKILKGKGAECVIAGCWHWTDPMLAVDLVRRVNLPIVLYANDDPDWAGVTCISAIGASLWQTLPNRHALVHKRLTGDLQSLVSWVKGVCSTEKLKSSSMLLWGGTYSLRMENLQDDIPKLKSFLVGDILNEDQYVLIKRTERLLKEKMPRIEKFISWLNGNKTKIIYDEKMLTQENFRKQVALYLASRDRLKELVNENITGVSIKCQPEIFAEYGVTACMLPAFLPYPVDSEGKREIIPTVCEGDIKGLIASVLLNLIEPKIPPLFGDLNYIGKDYFFIANCGAASIYYANYSNSPSIVLPKVTISAQCHGSGGGAVGFHTPPGKVTIARLVKIGGDYSMQLGLGEVVPIDKNIIKNIRWAKMWPRTAIRLNVDSKLLLQAAGSNHYSGLPGDYTQEITYACREAGIPIVRIDSEQDMKEMLKGF